MSAVRKDGYGGQSSGPSAEKTSSSDPILSLSPALVLMPPSSPKKKCWWGQTHLVAQTTTGNQQPEDMCGTTCTRGAGVRAGKS